MDTCATLAVVGGILLLALSPAIIVVLMAVIKASQRKKFHREVMQMRPDLFSRGKAIPVRYASERKFKRWLKLFPWETTGVLSIGERDVILLLQKLQGSENVELAFHYGEFWPSWAGPDVLKNGVTSWILLQTPYDKHYLSSETGAFVFGSSAGTHEIYDVLNRAAVLHAQR